MLEYILLYGTKHQILYFLPFLSYAYHGEGSSKGKIMHSPLFIYARMEIHLLLLELITDVPLYNYVIKADDVKHNTEQRHF